MQQTQWSGRISFIFATTASAVGLGNIWRFPYLVGENGGSAFVLMPITLHRFSTLTPLWDVPDRMAGSYYLKKGR